MSDFSLDEGRFSSGLGAAVVAGLKFLFIPLILVIATRALFTQMGVTGPTDGEINQLMDWVLILGLPIAVLSFFVGFYPRGSHSRLIFGIVVTALVMFWIWSVTRGGNLGVSFEQFGLALVFTGMVYLFLLAEALRGVYYVVEMLSYRNEWLASRRPTRFSEFKPPR